MKKYFCAYSCPANVADTIINAEIVINDKRSEVNFLLFFVFVFLSAIIKAGRPIEKIFIKETLRGVRENVT